MWTGKLRKNGTDLSLINKQKELMESSQHTINIFIIVTKIFY